MTDWRDVAMGVMMWGMLVWGAVWLHHIVSQGVMP